MAEVKAKPAAKKAVVKEKKYRCDFSTWEEYYKYDGPKG